MKVRFAIESTDTTHFFKMLRSQSLDYFFACLMIIFLKEKCRRSALTMIQTMRPLSLDFLCSRIGISKDDCVALFKAHGLDVLTDKKLPDVDKQTAWGKWHQKNPLSWHD